MDHPVYGAPLSGEVKEVGGVVFRPYRRGAAARSWCAIDDGKVAAEVTRMGAGYRATVNGITIPTRFGSETSALRAAAERIAVIIDQEAVMRETEFTAAEIAFRRAVAERDAEIDAVKRKHASRITKLLAELNRARSRLAGIRAGELAP